MPQLSVCSVSLTVHSCRYVVHHLQSSVCSVSLTVVTATYTPPRSFYVYSSASRSCKNVQVSLPHARRGRRGSEIYLYTNEGKTKILRSNCLLISLQESPDKDRSETVRLPFICPCYRCSCRSLLLAGSACGLFAPKLVGRF